MPRISGDKAVARRLKGLTGPEMVEVVGQALHAGADLIRAEASHLVTLHSVSGKGHVVSLPGQPPNEDTGALRSGFKAYRTAPLRAEATSESPHAVPLEAGTSKMAARPHMGPAARNKKKEIVALVERAVAAATRKRK